MNKMTKEERRIIEQIRTEVFSIMKEDSSGHDSTHIERVWRMARRIAEIEECDQFVVEVASLLHDLEDPKLAFRDKHQVATILKKYDISMERSQHILEMIASMSFSSHQKGYRVTTIEGMIVQDADRMDALGAIGIARTFAYGGSKHRPIYQGQDDDDSSIAHFYLKLLRLHSLMNLESSKAIAQERTNRMIQFLDWFHEEWQDDTLIQKTTGGNEQ